MTFGDENAIIYPLHKYILNTYHLSDRSQALKNQYDGGSIICTQFPGVLVKCNFLASLQPLWTKIM